MAKQSKLLEERQHKKMLRIYLVVGALAAAGAVLGAQTVLTAPPGGGNALVCPVTTGNHCAVIHVAGGDIVFEVHEKEVPGTAAHFIQLMQTGYYNGQKWHRVEDWVIQTGQGSEVSTIQHEWNPALHNDRAMVGVARTSDPDSGSSQFYILRSDARYLDYKDASNPGYTVFGTVRHGMDLVDQVKLNDPIVELKVVTEYRTA
jgi:cyclophilin family peptidyl-prolyl cis-trans isomerase